MAVFSLKDQFANYGEYHHNLINKLIHIIFVPTIVFTLMILLWDVNIPFPSQVTDVLAMLNNKYGWHLAANLSLVLLALIPYYLILEAGAGLVLACLSTVFYIYAGEIHNSWGSATAFKFALILHVFSWINQFIGHGVFERRRPALLDNVLQIFIAPLFVTLEVMFLFGYRPSLQKFVEDQVDLRLKKLKADSSAIAPKKTKKEM